MKKSNLRKKNFKESKLRREEDRRKAKKEINCIYITPPSQRQWLGFGFKFLNRMLEIVGAEVV